MKDSIPPAKHLDETIPIALGRSIIIDIPDYSQGKVDLYIDDGVSISCKPDDRNLQQLENAVPLAIYLVAREIHKNEPLPQDDMLTIHKMLAEGAAEETKIILGWLYDTCRLKVFLPEHKFISSTDIKKRKGVTTRTVHNQRQTSPLFHNSSPGKTFSQPYHRHGNKD